MEKNNGTKWSHMEPKKAEVEHNNGNRYERGNVAPEE